MSQEVTEICVIADVRERIVAAVFPPVDGALAAFVTSYKRDAPS